MKENSKKGSILEDDFEYPKERGAQQLPVRARDKGDKT